MKELPLCGAAGAGKFALVDDDDFEELSKYRWHLNDQGYVKRDEGRSSVRMHRVILGLGPDDPLVDHINRNRVDNRRENLRLCTQLQNCQNQPSRPGSISQYRGVGWDAARGKWMARAHHNYKSYNAGRFSSEIDAARAAQQLRLKLMPYAVEELIA